VNASQNPGVSPAAGDAHASKRAAHASNGGFTGLGGQAPSRPTISQIIDEVRAALAARLQLVELEAKRAALSAATMLAYAVGAALLAVTAWLILIGALIVGAASLGLPWPWAVAIAIALHAVAVFVLARAIRARVADLTFAATRRALFKSDHHRGVN